MVQPPGAKGSDSTEAGMTAPVPRSVGAKLPRPNDGNTATPTMRMVCTVTGPDVAVRLTAT